MAFGLQTLDRLERVETDGALRSTVVLAVSLSVALEPVGRHPRRLNRRLGNSTGRDADLDDPALHSRASSKDWLPRDCTRAVRSAAVAADHPLYARLQYLLAALVEHAVQVGDDAAVDLLGLSFIGDLDLHGQRVALEHRRRQTHLAAEVGHARPVDEPGLH